jgi:hypothetical protein
MPLSKPLLVLLAFLPSAAFAQELSVADSKIVESARAKYYDLAAAGFHSLSCSVAFDFSTVPLVSPSEDDPTRKLLENTRFDLDLDEKGRPSIAEHYPPGTSSAQEQTASRAANLLKALVGGLFQTWPSKGLQGPIPPFDAQIKSVKATDTGYAIDLFVPGAPVRVLLDKSFVATEILSQSGKLDEHPSYQLSPDGLIFTGNDVLDNTHPQPVKVRYSLDYIILDGLRVPSSARLRVNDNIDIKFKLDHCAVKKASVLRIPRAAIEVPETVMASHLDHSVPPTLPTGAVSRCSNSMAVVKVVIDTNGKVIDQIYTSGFEELKEPSLNAVRQWTYKPFELEGKTVPVQTQVSMFYLGDGTSFPVYSPDGKGGVKGGKTLPMPPGCGPAINIKRSSK